MKIAFYSVTIENMSQQSSILEIPPLHPFAKGYRIVFEKHHTSSGLKQLGVEEQKLFSNLYLKVQEDPKSSIESLKQLYERCPCVPEIANLLTYAYLRLQKKKQAEQLIEETWKRYPEHLISRINYADQALRCGKTELIPAIFNSCLDLGSLYPERDHFHYSEFRGFMTVMGFYYLEIGLREKAEECYSLAFQVDPLHPSVTVLEKKLCKHSSLKSLWLRLQKLGSIFKKP